MFRPELRGKPVVVLSNNDGCCIARSNEAKALGIEMGVPWHLNRERFARDGVIVRSSNYTLYGDMSGRVMRVLADFTPELEVYSIDEAFLGLAGFESRLEAHARVLRATVLLATANLVVFVETNRFRPDGPQHCASQAVQLPVATADTGKLTSATLRGLAAIWRGGFSYKKAGVMFLDLVPSSSVQIGLFDAPDSPARQRLMGIIDRLNARYGRDTVSFARSGRQRAWKLRSEHLSPRYTTSWEELLRVG